jgi:RNA polymerase sigma-70 factor (ECF subfamily)
VLRAQQNGDAAGEAAVAELFRTYWKPVYAFLRRQGHPQPDAEDLTQGFFSMLLDRNSLCGVGEERGRLRTFLLVALKRFVINEQQRARALKRGAGARHLALSGDEAEQVYQALVSNETPEVMYERQWALALLDAVLARLREDYFVTGRGDIFEALKDRLAGGQEGGSLATVAAGLGMTEAAVKVAVHRLRQRYRHLLEAEVERTVESQEEVEEEIAELFRVFQAR